MNYSAFLFAIESYDNIQNKERGKNVYKTYYFILDSIFFD